LLRNQQYEHAIASLEKAISIDPEFAPAYQQLGDIYRRQRNYEIAAKKYEKVTQLDPTLTPLTWFGLGESLLHIGNYHEALAALKRYRNTPGLSPDGKRRNDKYIADCEFAIKAVSE